MEKRTYPALAEEIVWHTLPNGLPIAVIPRPGFTKKMAYFVTDYGAIHTSFTLDGEAYTAPAGVAHFLEHKMFDLPGRDVMAEFAAMGANPNAFTSYDLTAYYFSCTDNFEDCLKLLLQYVSTPYFTKESVDKEQGIIGQEIGMYADNPESRVWEELAKGMYEKHPICVPILGSKESIAKITPEILHACHKAFYRPGNMLLCVVGDVDPEKVCEIAKEILPETDTCQVQRVQSWPEEMTCPQPLVEKQMEVAMPMFQLGFKCEAPEKGEEAVLWETVGDLAAEALFGESSPLYLKLYEQGLIDSSFGGGFETVDGMAMLVASGDSDDPKAVQKAILQQAQTLAQEGLPEEDFLRMKRSAMGRRLKGLDSFDSVAFRVCAYYFSGFDYFRFPEIYQKVQPSHLQEFIKRVVTAQRSCLAVIYPKEA
ncbi:MAG: insulinase family protein [Oscillospiraceae bacterium]|nr:insulinase family protein [Oscillospiraceae bacterium]